MSGQGSVLSVFYTVAKNKEISRMELAKITGFSLVSVGKAIDVLASLGLVSEEKLSKGTVGRKATVCRINKSGGMLVADFTGEKARLTAYDLSLCPRAECELDCKEPSEALMNGFGWFLDAFSGELLGIGCVVPNGMAEEYRTRLTAALGNPPELIIEEKQAWALSCSKGNGSEGMAVYIRVLDDYSPDGVLMQNGKIYGGANGNAGDFSKIPKSRESVISAIENITAVLDPETVYIAISNKDDEAFFASRLDNALIKPLSQCENILDGGAYALRERYIFSKLTKNS